MYFEIASRGKQMVPKEGLKNWHQFWVSICVSGGPNFGPPIPLNLVSERPQKWPPQVPKMGLCGGPIFGARFCEQFGFIMTARTKRKKIRQQKIETRDAQMNATKI